MGTDIHAVIEFRENDAAPWQAARGTYPEHEREPGEEYAWEVYGLDINRCYDLFSILGNVRNGYGFAGVRTGGGFIPMSDARGYPPDMSKEADEALSHEHSATYVTLQDEALSHEHSATYVTLQEILAYDWTRRTEKTGVVSAQTFEKWDRVRGWNPWPDEYCGGVSGLGVRHVTNDEMREIVKTTVGGARGQAYTEAVARLPENVYTSVEWGVSYADAGRSIWVEILPYMLKLGAQYGHDNVRLVMDFDN